MQSGGNELVRINGASSDKINVTGTADFSGGGSIAVSLLSAATQPFYDVLTAGNLIGTPTLSNTTVGRTTFSLAATHPANTIRINVTGGPANIRWTGADTAHDPTRWNNSQTDANWTTTDAVTDKTHFYDFDNVTFDDNNNNQYTVNLTGTVSPGSITVNNSSGDYVFGGSGVIAGIGGITKSGTRALTLSTANTYAGATTLNAGTLNINNATAIGTGALVINGGTIDNGSGADLTLSNNNPVTLGGNLTFTGTGNLNLGTGPVTLNANPTITVGANTLTIGGIISNGTGNKLAMAGAGNLILTGVNTFTGGININSGTVRLNNAAAGGTGTAVVNTGATLVAGGSLANPVTLAGGTFGAITGLGGFTGDFTAATGTTSTVYMSDPQNLLANSDEILNGNLQGSGNINLLAGSNNTGVDGGVGFRLRGIGASSFSGTITLNNNVKGEFQTTVSGTQFSPGGTGKVVMTAGDAALGGTTNAATATGGFTEFNIRNNSTGNALLGNNFEIVGTGLASINIPGSAPTGALSTLGSLKMGANQELTVYDSTGNVQTLAFQSVSLNGSTTFSPKKPTFGATTAIGGNLALGPITQSTPSGITMGGMLTLFLNGSNSFTGGLTINDGVVQLGNAGALNSAVPQAVTFAPSAGTNAPATLRLAGNSVTVSALNTDAGSPGTTFVENANVNPATLTINQSADNTFAGTMQDGVGGGPFSLVKNGSSTLNLTGDSTYTGTTTINGGTLHLGANGTTGSISATSGVTGPSGTLIFDRSDDITFAAPISGGIALTKLNSNALTLSGISSSTGATNINGGALIVNGALASTATVNMSSNTTLGGTGNGTTTGKLGNVILAATTNVRPGTSIADGNVGKLTLNSLSSSGTDFRLDLTSTTVGDLVAVTNSASFAAGTTSTFTPLFTSVPSAGSYTLLTAGSLSVGSGATLSLNLPSNNTRLTFALATTAGANGSVKLNISGAAANLTWTGAQTSDWDIINHTNWKSTSNPSEKYFDLDSVTFDDTSSASTHNVTLNATVTPASVTVAANTNYTISGGGGIAGVGGLTKSGTGNLTLSTNDSYLGPTAVQNGKLILGNSNALPVNTSLTLGSGATSGVVDLNGSTATVTSLSTSGTGTGNLIGNGGTGQATLTVAGGTSTYSGSIKDTITSGTGTLALAVTGGSLTLAGNNSYSGLTSVSSGATLQIGNGGTSGTLGNTQLNVDGTLAFNRSDNLSVAGTISGQGSLQQNGTGKLTLTADSTYAGPTVINAGTIQLGDSSVNSGATGNLGPGAITNNGTLIFNHSVDQTFNQVITGTGSVVQNGVSTLTLGGANTFAGGVTVNQGAVRVITPTGGAAASIGNGPIVVNAGATMVTGVGLTGPLTLAGGTIGSTFGTTATSWTTGDVTAAAGTTSTIYCADSQNPITADELIFTGNLHGSGNINVIAATAQTNPDGGTGFRLRGAGVSDFSGTITLGNGIKGELQTTVPGPFSPMGTGKLVMTAGTFTGSLNGTYSELNIRNNQSSGDTVFGNDISIAGTGFVSLNPLAGTAPSPNMDTFGNLKIGDGQILGINKNAAGTNTVQFTSATLLGGNATLSPTTFNYGSTGGGTANLILGPINETVAGSSITVDGQTTVFLKGVSTYTGSTNINRGTLQLMAPDVIPDTSNMTIGNAATGTVPTFASGGFNETLGKFNRR